MLKNYLKIAYKVLLRRKFFTFVSLFGISFTLVILMLSAAFVDHMFAPAKAGSKFERTLMIDRLDLRGEKMHISSFPTYYFLKQYVASMNRPAAISFHSRGSTTASYVRNRKVELKLKFTDEVFWDITEFDFLEGQPYDGSQVANAEAVAVINDYARKQIFGNKPAVGQFLETTHGSYRVVGVIPRREVPTFNANADIYVPVTTSPSAMTVTRLYGNYTAFLLAEKKSDFESIKAEFLTHLDQVRKDQEGTFDSVSCVLGTQADLVAAEIVGLRPGGGNFLAVGVVVALMILFMLFPAINLVNINISRIIERSSEIGVRKAFGASSKTLVGQFVVENVVLTLIGGAIAFVLTVILLDMLGDSRLVPYGELTLNIRIFMYSLLLCLFFGLFSGVLPAYKMSRLHPVEALRGSDA